MLAEGSHQEITSAELQQLIKTAEPTRHVQLLLPPFTIPRRCVLFRVKWNLTVQQSLSFLRGSRWNETVPVTPPPARCRCSPLFPARRPRGRLPAGNCGTFHELLRRRPVVVRLSDREALASVSIPTPARLVGNNERGTWVMCFCAAVMCASSSRSTLRGPKVQLCANNCNHQCAHYHICFYLQCYK